jgi:hypothetical protein
MKEELLHYLWKSVLYDSAELQTTEGIPLQILKHGETNVDAGPDFFNAKVKIGETLWAGNVEIHVRSSDWIRHGHHENQLYDSVILHVVYQNDVAVKRTNGTIIPTLVLPIDISITDTYNSFLMNKNQVVVCKDSFSTIDSFSVAMWLERMLIERLEQKTERVGEYLQETTTDWEDTFYRLLARSFGFNVNAQAFEQLSRLLPQQVLAKHKSSVFQLEALLFGVAGMLDTDCEDDYFLSLKKEFLFLQAKYSLTTLPFSSWKFMRMRPANFPTIRIAQIAQLIHHSSALFSKVIESEKIESLLSFFNVRFQPIGSLILVLENRRIIVQNILVKLPFKVF